jgi:F0F1-type ATP synthase membrane subunit b/b'
MLGLTEIRILPNWTILIELAVFLFVLAVTNTLIFRPMMKIMEKRKAFTIGSSEEAAKLTEEAEQLDAGRKEVLGMALREAQSDREQRIGTALREADKIKAEARSKMNETVSVTEISMAPSEKSISEEMDARAVELADMIVARFEE